MHWTQHIDSWSLQFEDNSIYMKMCVKSEKRCRSTNRQIAVMISRMIRTPFLKNELMKNFIVTAEMSQRLFFYKTVQIFFFFLIRSLNFELEILPAQILCCFKMSESRKCSIKSNIYKTIFWPVFLRIWIIKRSKFINFHTHWAPTMIAIASLSHTDLTPWPYNKCESNRLETKSKQSKYCSTQSIAIKKP